jgi:hypothetical protein
VVSALGAAALKLIGDLPSSGAWASGTSPDVVRLILILLQVRVTPRGGGGNQGEGLSVRGQREGEEGAKV